MKTNEMDRSGVIIIKICIFSIVLSLTALVLCGIFNYLDRKKALETFGEQDFVFVIDAGHGGADGGASTPDGTFEKDLNLSVALNLGMMLESSGKNVIYTRDGDYMLGGNSTGSRKMQDLSARLKYGNETPNAVFISIHMNKFAQSKYSGLQVFYSDNNELSQKLAGIIQSNSGKFLLPDNDREIKKAGSNIYLLKNMKNPAVLVECGFLSNPAECEKLKSESYRMELAAVIYSSVIEFSGEM